MIASTTAVQLRRCLAGVRFPASRDDLLNAAIRNRCDEDTVNAVRAIPPMTYTSATQVVASTTIVDIPGGGNGE